MVAKRAPGFRKEDRGPDETGEVERLIECRGLHVQKIGIGGEDDCPNPSARTRPPRQQPEQTKSGDHIGNDRHN